MEHFCCRLEIPRHARTEERARPGLDVRETGGPIPRNGPVSWSRPGSEWFLTLAHVRTGFPLGESESEKRKGGRKGRRSRLDVARVEALHLIAEESLIEVGVDLRRTDGAVSQHFLHHPDVCTAFHQVRCKGVAEGVRADLLANAGFVGGSAQHGEHHLPGQLTATATEEQGVLISGLDVHEVAVLFDVAGDGVQSELSNGVLLCQMRVRLGHGILNQPWSALLRTIPRAVLLPP